MSNLTIKLEKFKLNLISLLPEVTKETKEKIKSFNPIIGICLKWKEWDSLIGPTTCKECEELNGKIFDAKEYINTPTSLQMQM